jgi:hypothetical protein
MNALQSWRNPSAISLAALWLIAGAASVSGQDGKFKELKALTEFGGLVDSPPIEIQLGKTPKLRFLTVAGQGMVTAQVVLAPANKPEMVKARIVSIGRLWQDENKKDWEYRKTPQIKKVPFDDENGVTWSLLDGSTWKLDDVFVVAKKNLQDRVKAVPAYKFDGQNWFQKIGATNAVEGLEKALRFVETMAPDAKK